MRGEERGEVCAVKGEVCAVKGEVCFGLVGALSQSLGFEPGPAPTAYNAVASRRGQMHQGRTGRVRGLDICRVSSRMRSARCMRAPCMWKMFDIFKSARSQFDS